MRKLSILMPVYNERRTLRTIISKVLEIPVPMDLELVIVDDKSTDGSREILCELASREPRIKLVLKDNNEGKGAAIHTAISVMTGEIAIIQDADLEYDPVDIARVIQPILDGRADACFGSRYAGRDYRRVLNYWHTLMNKGLTVLANVVSDLDLTDMETCYKAVRSDILRNTILKCKRFGIEPELTIRLAQWGARIYEVPISYSGRTYAEGKKITWKDGLNALQVIVDVGFFDKRFTTHDGYYHSRSVRGPAINHWIFERIKPFVGRDVLEVGCGIGNLSQLLLDRDKLVCVDIDPLFIEMISRRFSHLENFEAIQADVNQIAEIGLQSPDTVLCVNVLEHLHDPVSAITQIWKLLKPGGNFICVVPQNPELYCALDDTIGHRQRFGRQTFVSIMSEVGFEIRAVSDFNKAGGLGWCAAKALGTKAISAEQMILFNGLLPLFKNFETFPLLPAASLICVAQKPEQVRLHSAAFATSQQGSVVSGRT